jgi:hypothetical protein
MVTSYPQYTTELANIQGWAGPLTADDRPPTVYLLKSSVVSGQQSAVFVAGRFPHCQKAAL